MRRLILIPALGLCLAAASLVSAPFNALEAAAGPTFIIPASDGYGVAECLATGGECASSVANAWCVAQGYHRAVSFGPAEITSSTGNSRPQPASVTITCDE